MIPSPAGQRRPILQYPHPLLRQRSELVLPNELDMPGFKAHLDDLVVTLSAHGGLGLSAPQIGWMKRVIAFPDVDPIAGADGLREVRIWILINPELGECQGPVVHRQEGCLSFAAGSRCLFDTLPMQEMCDASWTAPTGERVEAVFTELEARMFQHELDHLNGKVLVDRMGELQKRLFIAKLNKARKSFARAQGALS